MSSRAALWLLILTVFAPGVRAESVYVIEQLVVSVSSSPEADAERVAQVKSGDKLELLEREGEEAHVRLPNGKEGWIKSSYVSSEAPLSNRLSERTAEVEKLKQEGDKLRQEGEKARQEVARLQSQLAASHAPAATQNQVVAKGQVTTSGPMTRSPAPTSSNPEEATTSTSAEPAHESVFLREPERSGQTPWALLLGLAGLMLLVGFVLGWTTLDRRIRQKYGGLRIY
jgi:SH3 domain protein